MTELRMPRVAAGMSPQEILAACGGFYQCPKGVNGARLGPLVGYAGRDAEGRQYVGEIYANFAKIEQWPALVGGFIAEPFAAEISFLGSASFTFCGAPEGGKVLATELARVYGSRYVYPDKIVTKVGTPASKEESNLRFKRHDINVREPVILVEDVCNNFSTTAKLIAEIEAAGAWVAGIACFLNRSTLHRDLFTPKGGALKQHGYPIVALWRQAMPEWRQSDPLVAADIAVDNVVLDPKKGWDRLERAMAAHAV